MKTLFFARITLLSCVIAMFASACGPEVVTPTDDGILKGTISANRTLTDRVAGSGVDYIVQGELVVNSSAVLNVEPGVTIQFEQDASMLMIEMGALHAVGTAAKPILFTGKQATKGFWVGLFFINSDNLKNELTYCTVEYGGSDSYLYEEGNVILGSNPYGNARLSLNNTILRNSSSMGMYVSSDSYIDAFTNCTLTANNNAPIRVESNNSDVLDVSNDYSGNTENYVLIDGDPYQGQPILRNMTWHKLNVPYGIKDDITTQKTLTLEAGVTIHGLNNSGFYVDGEGVKLGKLQVNGTATNPVIMDGEQTTAGFWNGISLWGGDAVLTYCNIDHAGSYATFDGPSQRASIVAESFYEHVSNLTMSNCSISNSAHYGVAVDSDPDAGSGGVGSTFTNNGVVFTNCTDGDIYTY